MSGGMRGVLKTSFGMNVLALHGRRCIGLAFSGVLNGPAPLVQIRELTRGPFLDKGLAYR